jgi:glutaconate CoA-transferase subunit A
MKPQPQILSLAALVERVPDGCLLAAPADYSGVPMAATRALIRRKARDLRLFCVPFSTLQADLLIGSGCATAIEGAAVTLGEYGLAPRFTAAVEAGAIIMRDSTCPAVHAALQATEKGVPFMPLRGLIGSDILEHQPDWKVIDNPFEPNDPIVLLPAVAPDVALIHAEKADEEGNLWIGRRRELATLAHAAKRTLATVERIEKGSFFDDEATAAGVLPALYVEAIAEAPKGAWPLGMGDLYPEDGEHLRDYVRLARTPEGFASYLERHVTKRTAAA